MLLQNLISSEVVEIKQTSAVKFGLVELTISTVKRAFTHKARSRIVEVMGAEAFCIQYLNKDYAKGNWVII